MGKGLDTTFLVCAEVQEHPGHGAARDLLVALLDGGEPIGLAPQVLSEFVHIVTDGKRFERPLLMENAIFRARQWWEAREITKVLPSAESSQLFLSWMLEHRLGRKRILDTQLAATYFCAGMTTVVTTNARDFKLFAGLSVLEPSW